MSKSKSLRALVMCAALALSSSACFKQHYTGPASPGGQVHEKTQRFFVWGLAGGSDLALKQMCPNGVATIDSQQSVVDWLLLAVTAGLYSPLSVRVECASGAAYNVETISGKMRVSVASAKPAQH